MNLAVVSDSHSDIDKLKKLLSHLEDEGISLLAHAGDFMTFGVSKLFAEYPGIKIFIGRGNCDNNRNIVEKLHGLPHVQLDDVSYFEAGGVGFAISHVEGRAQRAAKDKKVDVFIHGHTHRAKIEQKEGSLVLNPGSLMDGAGFMLVEIPSLKIDRRFNF